MTLLIGALVVLAALLVYYYTTKESLLGSHTRILRTVGTYNDADEVNMPGVITSMPVLSYLHSYWDGRVLASCDECPSPIVCPECPQFRENAILWTPPGPAIAAEHPSVLTSGYAEPFEATPGGDDQTGATDAQYSDYSVYYDMTRPAEISRVSCGRHNKHGTAILRPATRSDDMFDATSWTHGCTIPIYTGRVGASPAMKLLYGSAMNLPETTPPAADPHTYLGYNGYVYKETTQN